MCTHLIAQKYKMQLIFQTNNPIHNCSPSPHEILLLNSSNMFIWLYFQLISSLHTHTHTNLCHVIFFSNPLCLCTRIISTSPLSPLLCITMLTLPCRHLQLLLCLHINQMAKKYFVWCITPKLIIWFANFLCYTSFLLHMFMLLFFCWVWDLNFYLFIDELSFESPKMIWKHIQKRLYTQTQNISNPIHTWIDSKLKHNSLH